MAVGFRFSLESLLRVRRHALKQAQRIVAARQREIATMNERIDGIGRDVHAQIGASRSLLVGDVDSRAIGSVGQYVLSLNRQADALRSQLLAHKRTLVDEQRKMVEASRRVKSLEKLRERRLAEFNQKLQRAERMMEDEVALNVYRMASDGARSERMFGDRVVTTRGT